MAGGSHLSKNIDSSRSSPSTKRRSAKEAPIRRSAQTDTQRRATVGQSAVEHGQSAAPRSAKHGRSRKKRRQKPLWPVIAVLVAVMLFALFMLSKTLISYFRNRSSYDALRDIAVVQLTPGPRTVTRETEEGTIEETVESEIPLEIDWETLRQTNSDIIGWLYCPDTVISYPVVRTTDNETYLTTNFEGAYNAGGAIFADYGSSVGFLSSHLILYGHNMKDNSMFGTLKNYGDPAYYEEHPVFYFLTPEQCYRVELLEAATISASLENYPTYFGSGETVESYIDRISRNVYWFNDKADYTSYQLMTMSTCTSGDDYRLIVQGVLVPIE